MQSWTPEMWQAAVIGLVVGVILGYLLLRLTKGSVKKQVQTEAELKEADAEYICDDVDEIADVLDLEEMMVRR